MSILTYDANNIPLFVRARPYIKPAGVLLDVGAGVRPQRFVPCRRHVCMEAHDEYCVVLREGGFETIQAEAPAGLLNIGPVDTVAAIDVIEHLSMADGFQLIRVAMLIAQQQVVFFTPLGFMPQDGGGEKDPWGYQGQRWQEHRSGWTPDDFPGWRCVVDEKFHFREGKPFGAFFAIWDRP